MTPKTKYTVQLIVPAASEGESATFPYVGSLYTNRDGQTFTLYLDADDPERGRTAYEIPKGARLLIRQAKTQPKAAAAPSEAPTTA